MSARGDGAGLSVGNRATERGPGTPIAIRAIRAIRAIPAIVAILGLAPLLPSCATPPLGPAERESLLRAPFSISPAHFFHGALLVPPLRRAEALPAGAAELRIGSQHQRSRNEETIAGVENEFDGLLHAVISAESAYGIGASREISLEAVYSGWDEELDEFELFDEGGSPIVSDEEAHLVLGQASSRHENLSVLRLRGLQELGGGEKWTCALEAALKVPFGRDRDLTHAGTYDPALTLRHSVHAGRWSAHSAAGFTWPIGEQNLFVEEADVELEPFLHIGAGAVRALGERWATGVQLLGHTSAFRDVEFLDHPAGGVLLGARHLLGPWSVEAGGGTGIGWDGSHRWLLFLGGTLRY